MTWNFAVSFLTTQLEKSPEPPAASQAPESQREPKPVPTSPEQMDGGAPNHVMMTEAFRALKLEPRVDMHETPKDYVLQVLYCLDSFIDLSHIRSLAGSLPLFLPLFISKPMLRLCLCMGFYRIRLIKNKDVCP